MSRKRYNNEYSELSVYQKGYADGMTASLEDTAISAYYAGVVMAKKHLETPI
jgi:hypothetical protein